MCDIRETSPQHCKSKSVHVNPAAEHFPCQLIFPSYGHVSLWDKRRGDNIDIRLTRDNKIPCISTHALFIPPAPCQKRVSPQKPVPKRSIYFSIHPSVWAATEIYDHITASLLWAHKRRRKSEAITSTSHSLIVSTYRFMCRCKIPYYNWHIYHSLSKSPRYPLYLHIQTLCGCGSFPEWLTAGVQ